MPTILSAAPYLFAILVLCACGTAAALGGSAGRWTALLYVSACLATNFAQYFNWNWAKPNHLVFAIDGALLVGLYVVALNSRRYWPLWLVGLHLLTVSAHVSAMIAPSFLWRVYFVLEVVWSLPKMGVLLIGVLADWRLDRERLSVPARHRRAGPRPR